MRKKELCILAFDKSNRTSFVNIDKWHDIQVHADKPVEAALEDPVEAQRQIFPGPAVCVLVGLKADVPPGPDSDVVTHAEGMLATTRLGLAGYFECSSRTGAGVRGLYSLDV